MTLVICNYSCTIQLDDRTNGSVVACYLPALFPMTRIENAVLITGVVVDSLYRRLAPIQGKISWYTWPLYPSVVA